VLEAWSTAQHQKTVILIVTVSPTHSFEHSYTVGNCVCVLVSYPSSSCIRYIVLALKLKIRFIIFISIERPVKFDGNEPFLSWRVTQFIATLSLQTALKYKIYKTTLKTELNTKTASRRLKPDSGLKHQKNLQPDSSTPHYSPVCISCYQSRHHRNLISISHPYRTNGALGQSSMTVIEYHIRSRSILFKNLTSQLISSMKHNFQQFWKQKNSSPCSQQDASDPYPKTDKSNLQPSTGFSQCVGYHKYHRWITWVHISVRRKSPLGHGSKLFIGSSVFVGRNTPLLTP
jgi:hypothetical protein